MQYQVNAMGKPCPIPVVETKKVLAKMTAGDSVTVSVDNPIAVQNLLKMAGQKQLAAESRTLASDHYEVVLALTEESLAAADIGVRINGVKTDATVNLATAAVTATGQAANVVPLLTATNTYKALIVPQEVAEGNLITVTVDGRDFNLKRGITLESGRMYRSTVTLSKTSNGINVSIDRWQDDGTDYGGTAE